MAKLIGFIFVAIAAIIWLIIGLLVGAVMLVIYIMFLPFFIVAAILK